jgi:dsDNA-binding SOS-regulon protein
MEDKEVSDEEITETKEEDFDVIKFFGLSKDAYDEVTVALKIQEKLGTTVGQMQEALSKSVVERAEELTLDFPNIAPLGDYDKLLEDNDSMAEFLKTEAHKPEHWKLDGIRLSDLNKELISFIFNNVAVDDGTTFKGFVFTTKLGKIKHSFAQVES